MPTFKTQIDTTKTWKAEAAILLYHGHQNEGFATIHDVIEDEGCKAGRLSPGRPMTTGELRNAIAHLDAVKPGKAKVALLPENLLAFAPGVLCWFRPPASAQLWFEVRDDHGKREKKHPLNRMSGGKFPMPGLVFLAKDGGLDVFAVKCRRTSHQSPVTSHRPNDKTKLHPAPFWNVSPRGDVCTGDMRMPASLSPASIAAIEKAFFQSNFTHVNGGKTHEGEHAELWRTARREKAFPERLLLKPLTTLGKILA